MQVHMHVERVCVCSYKCKSYGLQHSVHWITGTLVQHSQRARTCLRPCQKLALLLAVTSSPRVNGSDKTGWKHPPTQHVCRHVYNIYVHRFQLCKPIDTLHCGVIRVQIYTPGSVSRTPRPLTQSSSQPLPLQLMAAASKPLSH